MSGGWSSHPMLYHHSLPLDGDSPRALAVVPAAVSGLPVSPVGAGQAVHDPVNGINEAGNDAEE